MSDLSNDLERQAAELENLLVDDAQPDAEYLDNDMDSGDEVALKRENGGRKRHCTVLAANSLNSVIESLQNMNEIKSTYNLYDPINDDSFQGMEDASALQMEFSDLDSLISGMQSAVTLPSSPQASKPKADSTPAASEERETSADGSSTQLTQTADATETGPSAAAGEGEGAVEEISGPGEEEGPVEEVSVWNPEAETLDLDFGFGKAAPLPSLPLEVLAAQGEGRGGAVWSAQTPKENPFDRALQPELYQLSTYYFSVLCDHYYNEAKKKNVEPISFFQWTKAKTPYTVGFHALAERENLLTAEVSRGILVYTQDIKVKKNEQGPAEWLQRIAQIGIQYPEVRSEIYLQLIRHLIKNPHALSVQKGWELMKVMCGMFAPSSNFLPYLRVYLTECAEGVADAAASEGTLVISRNFSAECRELAVDALERLKKVFSQPRACPPSLKEITCTLNNTPFIIKVELPNDVSKKIPIEAHTTASKVIEGIAQKIKMKVTEGFALFLEKKTARFLLHDEKCVCDALYLQELRDKTAEEDTVTQSGPTAVDLMMGAGERPDVSTEAKLIIRRNVFVGSEDTMKGRTPCHVANDLIFHQIIPMYLRGLYPLSKKLVYEIAGRLWASEYPDHSLEHAQMLHRKLMPCYVKWRIEWDVIKDSHAQAMQDSPEESRAVVLDRLASQPLYGSSVFAVAQSFSPVLPTTLTIYVNRYGLHLLTPVQDVDEVTYSMPRVVDTFPFAQLDHKAWKMEKEYAHIEYTLPTRGTAQMTFDCLAQPQAALLIDTLNSYIQFLHKHTVFAVSSRVHDPADTDLLPFEKAERIFILDRSKESFGYIQGQIGDRIGWLPLSHVSFMVPIPDPYPIVVDDSFTFSADPDAGVFAFSH